MPTFEQKFPEHKPFKCCAAWHLCKSGQALAIYDFLGGITGGGKGLFFSSIHKVAVYFGANYESVRRAFKVLRALGFIELLPGGKFRYITHDDWAATHEGQCAERDLLPWQECSDPFVGEIWKIAGGKIRVVDWQIEAIRKYIGTAAFLEEFREEMEAAGLKRVPGGDWSGTAPKAIFWKTYRRFREALRPTATVEPHAYK